MAKNKINVQHFEQIYFVYAYEIHILTKKKEILASHAASTQTRC